MLGKYFGFSPITKEEKKERIIKMIIVILVWFVLITVLALWGDFSALGEAWVFAIGKLVITLLGVGLFGLFVRPEKKPEK
jgi:hypothetical protein